MLTRLVLVAAWSPFGFRSAYVWLSFGFHSILVGLVLVVLVLACLLLVGSLVVRSSGPVLDGVDDVLDAWFACLVCLLGLLAWFAWIVSVERKACLYIGAYAVHRPSFFTQQFTSL
jgi:hypothetical protein